jgi:hypothetical protein
MVRDSDPFRTGSDTVIRTEGSQMMYCTCEVGGSQGPAYSPAYARLGLVANIKHPKKKVI